MKHLTWLVSCSVFLLDCLGGHLCFPACSMFFQCVFKSDTCYDLVPRCSPKFPLFPTGDTVEKNRREEPSERKWDCWGMGLERCISSSPLSPKQWDRVSMDWKLWDLSKTNSCFLMSLPECFVTVTESWLTHPCQPGVRVCPLKDPVLMFIHKEVNWELALVCGPEHCDLPNFCLLQSLTLLYCSVTLQQCIRAFHMNIWTLPSSSDFWPSISSQSLFFQMYKSNPRDWLIVPLTVIPQYTSFALMCPDSTLPYSLPLWEHLGLISAWRDISF